MNINKIIFMLIIIFYVSVSSLIGLVAYELGFTAGMITQNGHTQDAFILGKQSATSEVTNFQIKTAIQYGLSHCNMTINLDDITIIKQNDTNK